MNRSVRPFLFTLLVNSPSTPAKLLKSLHQTRSFFFLPGKSQTKINFTDSCVVNLPQSLLYEVVADVDQYRHFVPNCLASEVLERRSPALMRAKLTVGVPRVMSADYISTIHLSKPSRIVARSEENKFMRYLESEWRFEPVGPGRHRGTTEKEKKDHPKPKERTLVKFRVEFELYSTVAAGLLSAVLDDFTRKTMEAFLQRAERMHRRAQLRPPRPAHSRQGSPSPSPPTDDDNLKTRKR